MSWYSKLKNALNPKRLDDDLEAEMRDHIERRADYLRANGLDLEKARHKASIQFGNLTSLREQSREVRLWAAVESTFQNVRYAWRGMRKSPAFAATAVLSLSLAIGANSAVYSIVDAAMLKPLPVPQPEQLFTLATPDIEQPGSESSGERETFNYPLYLQLRSAAKSSARLALFGYCNRVEAQTTTAGPLEKIGRQFVSGDAFEILGVPPESGRLFSAEEDRTPGAYPVAVLSYDYWSRRFGADPAMLGRSMRIEGKPYSIIGIARKGFFGIEPGVSPDVWIPAMMYHQEALANPGWGWFRILGRLSPGNTRERLQAMLQPLIQEHQKKMVERFPSIPAAIRKQFVQLVLLIHPGVVGASTFRKTFARPLWTILAVAGGILLIACANVASLLLARATSRSAEMAMRVSLGAGRWRVVRQLLTESLLLSVLAGGIGWTIARLAAPLLIAALSTANNPVRFALSMDTRVLLFCAALSTIAAVSFGLVPAWQATAAQPMTALRGYSGQTGSLRMGRFFVSLQVAFAFCLVIAGAGFLFSLHNLFAVDTGFDPRGVSVFSVSTDVPEGRSTVQRGLMNNLRLRTAALPGIQAAAMAPWSIFGGSSWTDQIVLPGKGPSDREELFYRVSPGYFSALRTPLISGRDFQTQDSVTNSPIPTIVNAALARRYFEGGNPVGLEFDRPEGKKLVRHRIVGVAANTHYRDLRKGPEPIAYVPLQGTDYFVLYVRSPLDLGTVVHMVERETRALGSGTRVREITTLDALVGETILKEKLLAGIGGAFAALGLLMAAIGLFGLLNYSVARRTKEIGIRSALGAQRRALALLVVKDLLAMVGSGLAAGLAGAMVLMSLLRSLLFGIKAADPLVIATALVTFLFAAFLAGALPALRAVSVDPIVALRQE